MGANDKVAATFHPAVLGYIVQCETCPQRAVVHGQPEGEWLCPRCAAARDPEPHPAPIIRATREVLEAEQNDAGNIAARQFVESELHRALQTPESAEQLVAKSVRAQDSVHHTCEICGREGSRRFTQTATRWRCSPTATKCPGNDEPLSDIPAKPFPPKVTPPPAPPAAPKPVVASGGITARCTDCPRTWNLTGRVLKSAIDTHEFTKQHIVDVHPEAYAS